MLVRWEIGQRDYRPVILVSGNSTSARNRAFALLDNATTYLVAHDESLTVRVPSQSEGITKAFHLINDGFSPYIPKLDNPITVTESVCFLL